jgi:8-oxo-dGTP diphosphatase
MESNDSPKSIRVGLGIVVQQNLILICKRLKNDSFGGFWELPGGKCEPHETPEQCVQRELFEEVAIRVTPMQALPPIPHAYPKIHVTLYPFICRHDSGEPTALCASELRWVPPKALLDFRFPPANRELVAMLAEARFVSGGIDLAFEEA